MAKENYVLLMGEVQSSPILNETKKRAKYVIQTLRRNDKIDYPVINVLDEFQFEKIGAYKEGDFVLVKGILTTGEVRKGVLCPYCGETIRTNGTTTEVVAIENVFLGTGFNLTDLKEVSNTVMLLGSLCRSPEFRMLANSGTASAQYQLAVNRKYNVKQQNSQTDYPWVNSFGKQAEQDAVRLDTGSQVFIHGGLQTRNVQKAMACPKCSRDFRAEDFVAEVVPYSVEYLNNCKF